MKALLVTRCGCSKLIDVSDSIGNVIYLPLEHKFSPEDFLENKEITPDMGVPEDRAFSVNGRIRVPGIRETVFTYKEV